LEIPAYEVLKKDIWTKMKESDWRIGKEYIMRSFAFLFFT
jgi:hypothetical protein